MGYFIVQATWEATATTNSSKLWQETWYLPDKSKGITVFLHGLEGCVESTWPTADDDDTLTPATPFTHTNNFWPPSSPTHLLLLFHYSSLPPLPSFHYYLLPLLLGYCTSLLKQQQPVLPYLFPSLPLTGLPFLMLFQFPLKFLDTLLFALPYVFQLIFPINIFPHFRTHCFTFPYIPR